MNTEYTFGGAEYVRAATHCHFFSMLEMLIRNMTDFRKLMIRGSVIEGGFDNSYAGVEIEELEILSGGSERC